MDRKATGARDITPTKSKQMKQMSKLGEYYCCFYIGTIAEGGMHKNSQYTTLKTAERERLSSQIFGYINGCSSICAEHNFRILYETSRAFQPPISQLIQVRFKCLFSTLKNQLKTYGHNSFVNNSNVRIG